MIDEVTWLPGLTIAIHIIAALFSECKYLAQPEACLFVCLLGF